MLILLNLTVNFTNAEQSSFLYYKFNLRYNYRMGFELLTPIQVWESFDTENYSLETSILSKNTHDGITAISLCYTPTMDNNDRVRAYLKLYYDESFESKRPLKIILPNAGYNPNYSSLIKRLAKDGNCVCILDYAGSLHEDAFTTKYPDSLDYAQFPNHLQYIGSINGTSVKDTAWYQWAYVIRRAFPVLKTSPVVDFEKISIIGFETGADLAWIIGGINKTISAVVPIGGGGFVWEKNISENSFDSEEENTCFAAGISAETYAKCLNADLLFIPFTNSQYYPLSHAKQIFATAASKNKQLLIEHSLGNQLSSACFEYLLYWLKHHCGNIPVEQPTIKTSLENSNDSLLCNIQSSKPFTKVEVFSASDTDMLISTVWNKETLEITNTNSSVPLAIENKNVPMFCFTTLTFKDGYIISSFPESIAVSTKSINHNNPNNLHFNHVLYDSRLSDCPFHVETNDIVLNENIVETKQSTSGICGITSNIGDLYLSKPANSLPKTSASSLFCCDYLTDKSRIINFKIRIYPTLETFSFTTEVSGSEFWQKLTFKVSDFKNHDGRSLSKISDGFLFYIENPNGCLFNNLLIV